MRRHGWIVISLLVGAHLSEGWAQPAPPPQSPPPTTEGTPTTEGSPTPVRRRGPVQATRSTRAAARRAAEAAAAPAPPAPSIRPSPSFAPASPGPSVMEVPGESEFNSCKKVPANKRLKFNFKPETEISEIIGSFSAITCTPFLTASTVSLQGKKVTLMAPTEITVGEAYRLFYAALESVGLTVEPQGRVLRIIDANNAKTSDLPFYRDNQSVPSDRRFVTKLLRIDNIDASELNNLVLQRLKGPQGDIVAYRHTLILTDTGDNVRRIEDLVREFDVPAANPRDKVWMVRIKNMSAIDMAQRLAEVVPVQQVGTGGVRRSPGAPAPAASPAPTAQATGQKSPLPGDLWNEMRVEKIIPDERSNSLLIVANDRAYEWLLAIIRKLDQPIGEGGDGKVHVYYCEHANCDELAGTLSAVAGVSVSGATGARRTRTSTSQPQSALPTPAMPVPSAPGQAQGGALLFEGEVRITFDPPTNSLLVVSSFKDFQALRRVIEKLDAPRKQVFVEALILEVLLDKTREVGVGYHGGKAVDLPGTGQQGLLLGGFEASRTINPVSLIGDLGGLTGALFGPTIPAQNVQIFGTAVQLPSFGVFLKLLQTNNDVNVLSNPHLLITNNQEGEISVGENLPFPGQLFGGLGGGLPGGQQGLGGFLPTVGVQRQDVALKMKILPSVNEHNIIRLDVDQEISDVSAPNFNGLGPATSKRAARTSVVARDQQTVVIGGLMTDRVSETVRKVPILGDIPLIGFFFRSTQKSMKKSNIIIALTPYVISDLSDLRRVAEKKLRERREFIDRYSALDDKATFESSIDYRRKRGMLEEINRTAREIESEESELRKVRERDLLEESTPIEPRTQAAAPAPAVRSASAVVPVRAPGPVEPPAAPAPEPPAPELPPLPPGAREE